MLTMLLVGTALAFGPSEPCDGEPRKHQRKLERLLDDAASFVHHPAVKQDLPELKRQLENSLAKETCLGEGVSRRIGHVYSVAFIAEFRRLEEGVSERFPWSVCESLIELQSSLHRQFRRANKVATHRTYWRAGPKTNRNMQGSASSFRASSRMLSAICSLPVARLPETEDSQQE